MKLEEKVLDNILDSSPLTLDEMILLDVKFWISKDYTEYPTKHHFIDVIQTQVLKEDTIILGSEKQFIKYQLK